MLDVFEEAAEEQRGRGRAVFLNFVIAEMTGLVIGAGAEWIAKFNCAIYQSNPATSSVAAYRILQKMRPPWVTQEVFFKAVDLIADKEATISRHQATLPDEVIEAQRRVESLLNCIVDAISSREFEKARSYSYEESKERANLHLLRRKYRIK
jgi:hypothetical protein